MAVPSRALRIYTADQPGAFVESIDSTTEIDNLLSDHRKNMALIGPGYSVGPATYSLVLRLLHSSRSVVLDADALTSFSADPQLLFDAIQARSAPTLLTSHEGEMIRLFGGKGAKIARVIDAAASSGAVVVLKGADFGCRTRWPRSYQHQWLALAGDRWLRRCVGWACRWSIEPGYVALACRLCCRLASRRS